MSGNLETRWLGKIAYMAAWELQKQLGAKRLAGEVPDTLLLLEHPPTITLGRGASRDHLLATPEVLQARGFDVVETNRGGDVTYHGPGQLVGYPILNLSEPPHKPDLHLYLRDLEEVIIRAISEFGLAGWRFPGYTGVWVGDRDKSARKIAAIGIHTSRWITQHGFALNVNSELDRFDVIVPCGIRDYRVTSVSAELGRSVEIAEVIAPVTASFTRIFEAQAGSVPSPT